MGLFRRRALQSRRRWGGIQDKIEPTCVSADVTQMALNEEECSHQEHPLLSATTEDEIACSTPKTPHLAPCIPHVHRHLLTSSGPPYVNWTFAGQFSSTLNLEVNNSCNRSVSFPYNEADFVYRGIRSNPPEITKMGVARGNYAQMHRKAWLEVSDKSHRYGKNLRMYYKHWEELGHPFHMFFDWLDSKGETIGNPCPACQRSLDQCWIPTRCFTLPILRSQQVMRWILWRILSTVLPIFFWMDIQSALERKAGSLSCVIMRVMDHKRWPLRRA